MSNLELLYTHASMLKPEEFIYAEVITEFDHEHNCGTVCCFIGWLPKWFPENFEYDLFRDAVNGDTVEFFDITTNEASAIFYGYDLKEPQLDTILRSRMESVTLSEGLERIEKLIEFKNKKNEQI